MKHLYVLVLAFSLIPLLPALSQTPDHLVATGPDLVFSEIKWNAIELDMGYPPCHEELTARFGFKNVGEVDLYINKVSSANGDIHISFPSERIAPGEEGEVIITYKPKRTGNFSYHISVSYNNPQPDILTLHGIAY